jgi:hypothetical protein
VSAMATKYHFNGGEESAGFSRNFISVCGFSLKQGFYHHNLFAIYYKQFGYNTHYSDKLNVTLKINKIK